MPDMKRFYIDYCIVLKIQITTVKINSENYPLFRP